MAEWLFWLIISVMLGVAEIFTLTAVLGMLGAAALTTAVFAAVGLPLTAQLVVFTIAAIAGLVLVGPAARRLLRQPPAQRFGVEALVGKKAFVVQEVTEQGGRVRIDGDEWSARAFDDSLVIPVGVAVDVMQISGSTAVVYPREY